MSGPAAHAPTPPVVQLLRVHGRDTFGSGGRARGRLYDVSLTFEAGIHAVLGRPRDGTTALCELIAGRARPRAGRVLVAGREPWRSPVLRRRIGAYLDRPTLVEAGRVGDAVAVASELRGIDVSASIAELGLADLLGRRMASLHAYEARALELAFALAVQRPAAVVLDEPLDATELVPAEALFERLAAMARDGAAVILTSSIPSDVEGVADHVHLVDRGRVVASDGALGWPGAGERELTVWLRDATLARRLASELGQAAALLGVAWRGRDGETASVSVRAAALDEAAVAVAAAVARTGIDVIGLQPVAPTLESLHVARRKRTAQEGAR